MTLATPSDNRRRTDNLHDQGTQMHFSKYSSFALGAFIFSTSALFGCEAVPDHGTAGGVEAEAEGLEARDFGTSYNGWKQAPAGTYRYTSSSNPPYDADFRVTFTRTSGDSTRGGGACVVVTDLTTQCDPGDDGPCVTKAQQVYGSDAYGYCGRDINNWDVCFLRPGSQSNFCTLGPNRTPGTYSRISGLFNFSGSQVPYVLSCMTKTAGPNTACGGTNQSLYMRAVAMMDEL